MLTCLQYLSSHYYPSQHLAKSVGDYAKGQKQWATLPSQMAGRSHTTQSGRKKVLSVFLKIEELIIVLN